MAELYALASRAGEGRSLAEIISLAPGATTRERLPIDVVKRCYDSRNCKMMRMVGNLYTGWKPSCDRWAAGIPDRSSRALSRASFSTSK